jgi:hypothetical protein
VVPRFAGVGQPFNGNADDSGKAWRKYPINAQYPQLRVLAASRSPAPGDEAGRSACYEGIGGCHENIVRLAAIAAAAGTRPPARALYNQTEGLRWAPKVIG